MAFRLIQFLFWLTLVIFGVRNLDFILRSLRWPASISLDASILRFEAHEIMQGRWPGSDFVSINLPVTHYINILGLVIFGLDDLAFRLLDVLWVAGIAALTYCYLRQFNLVAALTGALTILWLPVEATPYGAFQREVLLLPFLLGGALLLRKGRTGSGQLLLYAAAAMLCIFSFFIKPTIAIFWILLLTFELLRPAFLQQKLFEITASLAALFLGGVLAVCVVLLPIFLAGQLESYFSGWQMQTGAYLDLVERSGPVSLLGGLIAFDIRSFFIALNQPYRSAVDTGHINLFFLGAALAWCFLALKKRWNPFPALLLAAGLAAYFLQMRGFQYHLYPVWAGLMLMLAMLLGWLYHTNRIYGSAIAVMLALCLLVVQHNSLRVYAGTGLLRGKVPQFVVQEEIDAIAVAQSGRSARKIRMAAFEHASIALGAVFRGHVESISPYPVDYILRKPSPHRAQARSRLMASLEDRQPEILVFSMERQMQKEPGRIRMEKGHVHDALPEAYADFVELRELIARDFALEALIAERNGDTYAIYLRSWR